MTPDRVDRGIALPLALFVIAVLGAVIATTLWAAHMEARAGRQSLQALKARAAADLAWPDVLQRADSLTLSTIAPGDSMTLGWRTGTGGVRVRVVLHRLGPEFFLIESLGMVGSRPAAPQASFRVQVLARSHVSVDAVTGQPVTRLSPLAAPYWSGLPRAN